MRIGELSTRSGRSVHAIRWYESQGLVPGVERDTGRRRVYTELHVGWLDFMDRLRRTGMTIALEGGASHDRRQDRFLRGVARDRKETQKDATVA